MRRQNADWEPAIKTQLSLVNWDAAMEMLDTVTLVMWCEVCFAAAQRPQLHQL
jgi:hypothetical protein